MPVRPRDAATLILLREGASGTDVLMGRRLRKASFAPDVFVFPGGRVDRADSLAHPASTLSPHDQALLARDGAAPPAMARALANAAIRETYEETGLLVAASGDVGTVANESWNAFRDAGLAPDHAPLRFLARAITPSSSPIRFHARFFLADGAHATGTIGGSGELTDLAWYPLAEAQKLPLFDITEFILALIASGGHSNRERAPLFGYRAERPLIRRHTP